MEIGMLANCASWFYILFCNYEDNHGASLFCFTFWFVDNHSAVCSCICVLRNDIKQTNTLTATAYTVYKHVLWYNDMKIYLEYVWKLILQTSNTNSNACIPALTRTHNFGMLQLTRTHVLVWYVTNTRRTHDLAWYFSFCYN